MEGGVSLPAGAGPPGRAATDNWSRVTLKLRPGTHQTPWAARGRLPPVEFVFGFTLFWRKYAAVETQPLSGSVKSLNFTTRGGSPVGNRP